mgnify:CR=1 FL=1
MMMDALTDITTILRRYLTPGQYDVFLFGSRAGGEASRFSDYDIGIRGEKPLPPLVKATIEEALEESDIPYSVDVVDFFFLPERFRGVALSHTQKLSV